MTVPYAPTARSEKQQRKDKERAWRVIIEGHNNKARDRFLRIFRKPGIDVPPWFYGVHIGRGTKVNAHAVTDVGDFPLYIKFLPNKNPSRGTTPLSKGGSIILRIGGLSDGDIRRELIALLKGCRAELRFMEALETAALPSWYGGARHGTCGEDRNGFDLFVSVNGLELPFQIKSSEQGARRYLENNPATPAILFVVGEYESLESIRERAIAAIVTRPNP